MSVSWRALSRTTKWSVIAFFVTGALGLLSMGGLSFGLYYLVAFLFSNYPDINTWHGDWVWPAMIGAGLLWAFGFAWAGILLFFLSKILESFVLRCLIYIFILWFWAAVVWGILIKANL